MSEYTNSLLNGIAGLLDDAEVGVFDTTRVITPDETGIFRGAMPDQPDRALVINDYPVDDNDTTNAITGVQFRMRAGRDPNAIGDMADAVFNAFHNRQHYECGGIHVSLSWRQSQAWIGQDTQGRMELTANFYFRTVRSGSHLID
ncbi:minor capsid protein [Streptomyces prunicolor]|uniref:minor capsid protein n=1 Tax=Streptomyces prunicolor TaxID=67348 RepID=UPI0037157848